MDYMAPVFKGGKRFKITIEKEGWWKSFSCKCNALNFYMDGSKMTSGVGTGMYCPELDLRKLPDQSTALQAEVFVVEKAADLVCYTTGTDFNVNFSIDNQAVIIANTYLSITFKIVLQWRESVERLASNCKTHFYWVPHPKSI